MEEEERIMQGKKIRLIKLALALASMYGIITIFLLAIIFLAVASR